MPRFRYDKLVRDNIPGWHVVEGHTVHARTLQGVDLKHALIQKLHEEADEIPISDVASDAVTEELADVYQVFCDLAETYGLSMEQIEAVRRTKLYKKGGFLGGHYVEEIAMPTEDTWTEYCRNSPDKYPEIQ